MLLCLSLALLPALPGLGGSSAVLAAQAEEADELESYKLGIGFYERERYRQAVDAPTSS